MKRAEQQMQFMLMLRNCGITDLRVLKAMEKVPRDLFVQGHFQPHAYENMALPIQAGQTISQPSVVAEMTIALDVQPRNTVLEIGTGSGYQAAILSHLCRRLYTVERHRQLARTARERIDGLGLVNVTCITGDGTRGLPDQAPFDRILLTAAAEDPPANLLAQLRVGGRSDRAGAVGGRSQAERISHDPLRWPVRGNLQSGLPGSRVLRPIFGTKIWTSHG